MASNFYRRREWREFRALCLDRAGHRCERCEQPGILQVHHPEYQLGKKPWEYEIQFCEVLCRGCHAGEHGIIMPREGWTVLYSDLENNEPSDPVPCANCGAQVTWHFAIYHPEWGETIVGSECADNLSMGEEVMAAKSFARRLRTFVYSPRWKLTPIGWIIRQSGYYVLLCESAGRFRLVIDGKRGAIEFKTPQEAKVRAFEVIENRLENIAEREALREEYRDPPDD